MLLHLGGGHVQSAKYILTGDLRLMNVQQQISELIRIETERDYYDVFGKLEQALKRFGQVRDVKFLAAKIYLAIRKPDLAAKYFHLVIEQDKVEKQTQHADVLLLLGRALVETGEFAKARQLFDAVDKRMPNNGEVLGWLAKIARREDNLELAYQLSEKAIAADEGSIQARLAAALMADEQGDGAQALALLEKNIGSAPPHGESIDKWLEILKRKEQWRYAREKLTDFASQYPTILEFVYGLAVVCNNLGELDAARDYFVKTIELSPKNSRVVYELGVLERISGNLERANELIERSLSMNPDNPAAIRTFGSEHKYESDDLAAQRLHLVAARLTDMTDLEQVHTHYALAKYFEDLGNLRTAFRHYGYAGRKHNKVMPFQYNAVQEHSNLTKKYVTKALVNATGQQGYASEVPIFILGMPRSGTSLLEQILSYHPMIYGAGELKYMGSVLENVGVGKDGRLLLGNKEPVFKYDENATYEQRGKAYVDYVTSLAGNKYERVIDKMPGNFNFLGLIRAILPNAKIIHSRRHPIETCLSNYRINFAEGQLWSYNLTHLGQYYRTYWDLMKHWRSEFPSQFLEVRYEDNVLDLEKSSKRIMDYIGLDWDAKLLNFHENDRAVKTASITQVRRPIYRTSMNRWKKYTEFLGPLLEEIGDLVEEYESEIPDAFD